MSQKTSPTLSIVLEEGLSNFNEFWHVETLLLVLKCMLCVSLQTTADGASNISAPSPSVSCTTVFVDEGCVKYRTASASATTTSATAVLKLLTFNY